VTKLIKPTRVGGMMITSTYKNAPIHRILELERKLKEKKDGLNIHKRGSKLSKGSKNFY